MTKTVRIPNIWMTQSFKLPTPLVLSKVVDSLDEIYKMMSEIQATDVRGDVYEYLLSKIAQSGRNVSLEHLATLFV